MKKITIHFTVNHEPVTVEVEPNHRLIDVLRNNLGLTSVKEGCSEGECGACTVIYNGEPVTSCCILAGQADGADIITLEGVSKDGQPDVVQQAFMDAGAYGSYGPAVIGRFPVHAVGPYDCPNVRLDAVFAYTNNPMCGAFRGFGVPQAAVVHEGQMDALAAALHMSPLEIRRINGHHVGSTIPTGQTLTESVGYQDTLAEAIKKAEEVMPDALERLDPDWRPQI